MKRMHLVLLAILAALSVLFLIGCDEEEDRTMIGAIQDRPSRYMDEDVIVGGRVTNTRRANMFTGGAGMYQLDDGSGRIWVITKRSVPDRDDEVGLRGSVDDGIRLFGERFGVVIREHERRIRDHSSDYDRDRCDDRDRDRDRDRDWDRDKDWDRDRDRDRDRDYDRDRDRSYDRR